MKCEAAEIFATRDRVMRMGRTMDYLQLAQSFLQHAQRASSAQSVSLAFGQMLHVLGFRYYAQRKPCFESGSDRTRVPDAAKIALATAGSTGGSDGSPRPVGGLSDLIQCVSITAGA